MFQWIGMVPNLQRNLRVWEMLLLPFNCIMSIHISSEQLLAYYINCPLNMWASFMRNHLEVIFPGALTLLLLGCLEGGRVG
jgi:hypothetical protein